MPKCPFLLDDLRAALPECTRDEDCIKEAWIMILKNTGRTQFQILHFPFFGVNATRIC